MAPKTGSGRPELGGIANTTSGTNSGANPGAGAAKEPVNTLDLSAFLSCLEQEVGDLHTTIKSSRDSRVEKAFQRVPRSMRRRTASHNAKRLPRRLRNQAHRDQAADNTPSIATGLAKRKKARPASAWVYENTKKRVKLQQEKKLAAQGGGDGDGIDDSSDDEHHGTMGSGDDSDNDQPGGVALPVAPRPPLPVKNLRLPTHRWHAKRALMDSPGFLWNNTIVRTPANKVYRMSLRSTGLRPGMCVCWDTSYKATILLQGKAKHVDEALMLVVEPHLLTPALKKGACSVDAKLPRSFGYQQQHQTGPGGNAALNAYGELSGPGNCGAMTIFYDPITETITDETKRKVFLRVHPAIFSCVWTTLNNGIAKKQLPVAVRDFRLEIGSIDVTGSAAAEMVAATIYPFETKNTPMEALGREFLKLRKMDTGALAPASGAMLAFNIQDPRLDEPNDIDIGSKIGSSTGRIGRTSALQAWPETDERLPSGLFDTDIRHTATKLAPLDALNKRRGKMAAGGKLLVDSNGRPIPVIFAASGSSSVSAEADPHASNRSSSDSASWTLLAPRACIDAIWLRLHVQCLPSGHRPLYAGFEEEHHMALERGRPWFPADFPGTPTGWDWELQSRNGHEKAWREKPTAKRTQWDTLNLGNKTKGELGSGFACDWEFLFGVDTIPATRAAATSEQKSTAEKQTTQTSADSAAADTKMGDAEGGDDDGLEEEVQFTALRPRKGMADLVRGMQHATWADVRAAVQSTRLERPVVWRTPYQLMTISVRLLQGGTPDARARIYRLPDASGESGAGKGSLRARWLAFAGNTDLHKLGRNQSRASQPQRMPADADMATRKKLLAQSLLETRLPYPRSAAEGLPGFAASAHLPVPGREDLIGFVTSGAQRFQSGRGFGIGHVSAQKLVETIIAADGEAERGQGPRGLGGQTGTAASFHIPINKDARLCIVRNAGEEVGRLARWTPISN